MAALAKLLKNPKVVAVILDRKRVTVVTKPNKGKPVTSLKTLRQIERELDVSRKR